MALLGDGDHHRRARQANVEADDIVELAAKSGSVERLKVLVRCGCSLCACQMLWIVRTDRVMALAMARPVQCDTAPGSCRRVRSITA